MELAKWKRAKKQGEQLNLSIIENANNNIKDAYYACQWVTIHQGNDSY